VPGARCRASAGIWSEPPVPATSNGKQSHPDISRGRPFSTVSHGTGDAITRASLKRYGAESKGGHGGGRTGGARSEERGARRARAGQRYALLAPRRCAERGEVGAVRAADRPLRRGVELPGDFGRGDARERRGGWGGDCRDRSAGDARAPRRFRGGAGGAPRRADRSASTPARSASLISAQRAISSSVRWQPTHSRRRGSIWQTSMQGDSITPPSCVWRQLPCRPWTKARAPARHRSTDRSI